MLQVHRGTPRVPTPSYPSMRLASILTAGGLCLMTLVLARCDFMHRFLGSVDTGPGPCPAAMVRIDAFCIDRWEAHLQDHSPYDVPREGIAVTAPGVIPQGYISADVAAAACQARGMRSKSSKRLRLS